MKGAKPDHEMNKLIIKLEGVKIITRKRDENRVKSRLFGCIFEAELLIQIITNESPDCEI